MDGEEAAASVSWVRRDLYSPYKSFFFLYVCGDENRGSFTGKYSCCCFPYTVGTVGKSRSAARF